MRSVPSERFVYIWQYTIRPTFRKEFLAAYEPGGEWSRLFSRDPSYIETLLLMDDNNPDRYVTIDFGTSRAARDLFRQRFADDYDRLDVRCEAFTTDEQFLGDYSQSGDARS